MRLFLTFLLLSFILTNCPTENDPNLVEMTASVNPEEAGEVNPPEGTYTIGREINIETEPADDRWNFTGWSGDTTASDDSLSFEISRDMELIANYEIPSDERPVLTTGIQPDEAGSVDPDSGSFDLGASIEVVAIPNEGWEFVEWSGDTTGTDNIISIVMGKDYDLTANFERQLFNLSTSVNIDEAGTVEPQEGEFEYESTVEIEAIPEEGWQFGEWSGDTSATANPLELTMIKDYELTASFNQLSQAFTNQITVRDDSSSMELFFGMDASATADFDSGIDRELPPPPPEGSFYGQFNITNYNLAEDYRAIQEQTTIWEIEVAPDSGQSIVLSWDFSNTDHIGSLTLTDDPENPSFEVDMKSNTFYEASDEPVQTLYIISNNEN